MRRQFGADAVDLDTRQSTCHLAFDEPEVLDFALAQAAAADANYQLVGIALQARGEAVVSSCDVCGQNVGYLRLPTTDQLLELVEPAPLGQVDLHADVIDWASPHPRLVLRRSL